MNPTMSYFCLTTEITYVDFYRPVLCGPNVHLKSRSLGGSPRIVHPPGIWFLLRKSETLERRTILVSTSWKTHGSYLDTLFFCSRTEKSTNRQVIVVYVMTPTRLLPNILVTSIFPWKSYNNNNNNNHHNHNRKSGLFKYSRILWTRLRTFLLSSNND